MKPDERNSPPTEERDTRGAIGWMAWNQVTPNLLMALLVIGGILSSTRIKQEVFPEFTLDAVTIGVAYPGASPEEVEQGILLAIEEAVRGIENVVEINSTAGEGSAQVVAEYEPGTDPQKFYQDIVQEIERIRTFPEDAEEPQITLASRRRDVMDIQLYGDTSEWALRNLAEEVRERLLQADGVTQVELSGAREFEVQILPSREMLRVYGLTLQDVADRVARSSVKIPGGGIETDGGEVLVRFDERRDYAREFAEIPLITTSQGAVVRLGDIASVQEGFEDVEDHASYDGKPAIGIEIFRTGDQTPTGVSRAVRTALEEIEADLPEGVALAINDDDSEIYKQRRDLLLKNMGIGLTLVLILLALFLEPRLAFWVTLGIPISFLGTFLLLPALGVSLNMISMFAFIIALGIVVDDAIIVGENVHEYRKRGMKPLQAAIQGARDVAMPVTFSILTNCVTFLPLALIPGTIGKIWFVIPIVVNTIFLISLIESLFILPAHLSKLAPEPTNPVFRALRRLERVTSGALDWFIANAFARGLTACLHARYLVVACSVSLLAIMLAYAMSGRMGMTLMPKVESDRAVVSAALPVGSPVNEVERVARHLEAAARRVVAANGGDNLATGIYTEVGGDNIEIDLYLTPPRVRPISTYEVAQRWRAEAGEITGLDVLRFESDRGGPGGGASLRVQISHPSVPTLERAAEQLGQTLAQFPQVSDIDDGFARGKEQLDFTLNAKGRSLGLTSASVARQIRNSFQGTEAIRQLRGRNEVTVRVMLPEDQRRSEYDIEHLMIQTPSGVDVPLREVAEVQRGRAYTTIRRTDGSRSLGVSANVTPDSMTNLVQAALVNDILPGLMNDYPGLTWSYGGRQQDMRESLQSLGVTFILALLAIYALLAIPFRSYTQPFIVMAAIPFGIVGAVLGHLIMGYSLSVISMMGIIALSGVVINGALVMLVYANEQRDKGMSIFDAIHAAGVRRFRPILLTTLTTFGGLAPMIFESSRQARFMIPMAISLGYGLLFATAITLVLVPALYVIRDDVDRALQWIMGEDDNATSRPALGEMEAPESGG
jgi:multidrug efflux pump subunit AcrB